MTKEIGVDYSAWANKGKKVSVNTGLLSGAMGRIKSANQKRGTAVVEFSLVPHKKSRLWVDKRPLGILDLSASQLGALTITAVITLPLAHLTPCYVASLPPVEKVKG